MPTTSDLQPRKQQLSQAAPEQAPAAFVEMANDRGGRDNITVVLVFAD